jgi:hypothetical protein
MYLKKFFHFIDPDGDSGGADRGDDFVPTGPDAVETKIEPKAADVAAADALEAEIATEKVEKVVDEPADGEKVDGKVEDKPKGKDSRIPAARHKEILDKERGRREALEVELAQYRQGGKIADLNVELTAAEDSVLTMEKEYAKLLTDGETEKAAAVMSKIRRTERAIIEKSSEVREQAAEARAVERVRFDTTVERLEAQYPALQVGNDAFDGDKVAEVLELKEAYETKGYTPSAALQKAVKLIMPPETKAQEKAVEVTPNVDAKAVEKARKAAAVEKTAAAVGKTPASSSKVGIDSDKSGGGAVTGTDVMKMPYEDFKKLDDNTLAKLRGDVI